MKLNCPGNLYFNGSTTKVIYSETVEGDTYEK